MPAEDVDPGRDRRRAPDPSDGRTARPGRRAGRRRSAPASGQLRLRPLLGEAGSAPVAGAAQQPGPQRREHEQARPPAAAGRRAAGAGCRRPRGRARPGRPARPRGVQVRRLVPRRRHQRLLLPLHHQRAEGGRDPCRRVGVELLVPASRSPPGRAAGARRYGGAVARRGEQRVARPGRWSGVLSTSTQRRRRTGPPAPGPTTARRVRRAPAARPPSRTWASSVPASPSPAVDRSTGRVPKPSATGRPRIASASDWKSPAGPVANRQWWYTGSSTGAMPGASFHAGPSAPAGSSPSPAAGRPRTSARRRRGTRSARRAAARRPAGTGCGPGRRRARPRARRRSSPRRRRAGRAPTPSESVEVGQLHLGSGRWRRSSAPAASRARVASSRTPGCSRDHDEAQPGPQPSGRRRGGREQPRQRRLVELDEREVVGLERAAFRAPGRCG